MELYQLRTFVAAAETQSFSRAAQQMSLSQSAVSRQIDALEGDCGIPLFVRGGRGARLTEAGERLLIYAQDILRATRDAGTALRELRELEAGELVIGATAVPARFVVTPVIVEFAHQHPRIAPRLVVAGVSGLVDALLSGSLHIAMLSGPFTSHDLSLEPQGGDSLVLVAPVDHPLAGRGRADPGELRAERLIVPSAGGCERAAIDAYLAAHNLRDGLRTWEFDDGESIKQAVMAGGGLAFLSDLTVREEMRTGRLTRIRGPEVTIPRQFYLAYSKAGRRLPSVLAFSALLRKTRAVQDVEEQARREP